MTNLCDTNSAASDSALYFASSHPSPSVPVSSTLSTTLPVVAASRDVHTPPLEDSSPDDGALLPLVTTSLCKEENNVKSGRCIVAPPKSSSWLKSKAIKAQGRHIDLKTVTKPVLLQSQRKVVSKTVSDYQVSVNKRQLHFSRELNQPAVILCEQKSLVYMLEGEVYKSFCGLVSCRFPAVSGTRPRSHKEYLCNFCHIVSASLEDLQTHLMQHLFFCDHCEKRYFCHFSLINHVYHHHHMNHDDLRGMKCTPNMRKIFPPMSIFQILIMQLRHSKHVKHSLEILFQSCLLGQWFHQQT